MADNPLTIFEKYPNSWRIDHPDFGDVCKTNHAKGVVTAFYPANDDDPVVAKDICDLTIDGQEFKEVPIFYHPSKVYADNWKLNTDPSIHPYGSLLSNSEAWADFWKASGALVDAESKPITDIPKEGLAFKDQTVARGAYSFSVGDEVAVMLQNGVPVAVVGFADGIPRRPFDYVKVEMPPQIIDSLDPSWVGDPHCPYILQLSDSNRNFTPSGSNPGYDPPTGGSLGPDGFDLKLLKDARIFPDKVANFPDSGVYDFTFDFNYYCFYEPTVMGNRIELTGSNWDPPPAPAFGPHYGNMFFSWGQYEPWADYLALWLNICDTQQVLGMPYVGLWPGGAGRPLFWAFTASDGSYSGSEKYVMRTFLIEAGPKLYVVRVFYYHSLFNYMTNLYLWKNRIIWPWSGYPPPAGWSGYTDLADWTVPMDVGNGAWPSEIGGCKPAPDDTWNLPYQSEYFFSDNPHYIYSAPSSKKILDNIESIVGASNAVVDVQAVQQGTSYDSVQPPEGFRNIFGPGVSYGLPPGFIPNVGNLRELNFKIANKEQPYG